MTASRGYFLAVLAVLSAFNQLDRQLTAILLEPIRREFALTDIQLGLLSGLAFAVFYATLSIPAALWAVHRNRRNLVAASAAVWGAMTAFSGMAQSFTQLLIGRIGIGAGEAGAMPASHAMISDLYAPHERATAMAVWSGGVNIGIFLAFLVGGVVGQYYGWRAAFIACGVATVLVAAVVRFTIAEPTRSPDIARERLSTAPSRTLIRTTIALMWNDRVIRHTTLAATVTAIIGYGAISWMPSFLVRSHGLGVAAVGLYLALVIGLGGAIVGMLGGRLSDTLGRRDVRWSLWFIGLAVILTKPLAITFYVAPNTAVALAAFVLPGVIATIYIGPAIAVVHNRIPPTLRPTASAVFLFIVNLVGLGLGPLFVGMMSQWLFAGSGARSLGYALAVMQIVGIWGAAHFLLAGRLMRSGADEPAARTA